MLSQMRNISLVFILIIHFSCKKHTTQYTNVFNDPLFYSRTVKELNNVVMQNNFPPIIASRNYLFWSKIGDR